MRKVNFIIWHLIIFFFIVISGYLLISDNLTLYLAPRMKPMVYFGFMVFIILFIFQLENAEQSKNNEKDTFNLKYLLFIIPILLYFTATPNADTANSLPNQNLSLSHNAADEQTTSNSTDNKSDDTYESQSDSGNNDVSVDDEVQSEETEINYDDIEIAEITPCILTDVQRRDESTDQFVEFLYFETYEMINKEATMYGFVFKDDSLPENTIVVARQIVSCCIADAYVAGYPVSVENPDELAEGDWIEVTGIMSKVELLTNGDTYDYPIMVGGTIIMCDAPPLDEMYIYP